MIGQLRGIVGAAHVLTGVECSPYVLEGRTPEAVVFPGTKEEVAAVLVLAGEEGVPVTPWGGGTRLGVGAPPARVGVVLGMKRLNRVLEHEPGDLTATVETGITLSAFQAELGRRGQWLSLDPPFADKSTLGGILASNAAGPRRHLYGTCRDLLIGITVVSADGSLVRGGGKVVKNVAGYDLPKLYIGSHGTLGVLVEATFRLRPRPDEDRLVVARFERIEEAGAAARAVISSDLIPSALELVDGGAMRALGIDAGAGLLVGVDGIREQVEWQCGELGGLLGRSARPSRRCSRARRPRRCGDELGELGGRGADDVAAVMRWGVLPTNLARRHGRERGGGHEERAPGRADGACRRRVGHGGAVGRRRDANAVVATLTEWRSIVNGTGGHAMVEWAPLAVKERVSVWDAPGPAIRIMKSIKDRLDPRGILNPGRFVGGI